MAWPTVSGRSRVQMTTDIFTILSSGRGLAPSLAPHGVRRIGKAHGDLGYVEHELVDPLDALHERVVLVRDFVTPGAETAARHDPGLAQRRLDLAQELV